MNSDNKKLIYIANARIPTEKAHGIQIMKTCEAFANAGVNVELVLPWRFNKIKQDPFEYYGIEKNFKITKVFSLDLVKFGRIGFWIQLLSFTEVVFYYTLFKKADIIYSRDELPLFYLSFFKKNIFWETHTARNNFIVKRMFKKSAGIVSITQGLKDFYIKKYGVGANGILVAPDGVDLEKFDIKISKEDARKKLNLPIDKKLILYTGHLYGWKGAQTLADSANFFNNNELIIFIGGTEKDIKEFKEKNKDIKNILVVGKKPYSEIPLYLKSADILVLPNSTKSKISKFYTSPMKLFEYMASERPIVASDLPSTREILNENNSILVKPDNAEALSVGIKKVLQSPDFAGKISKQAYYDVMEYTWEKRAKGILNFIQKSK